MRIVFDACLPPFLVDALTPVISPAATFEHVTRLYGEGAKDVDWIARLTSEGGALFVTYDKHMKRRPLEVQALLASQCVGIVLAPGWQEDDDCTLTARLLLHWPHIIAAARMKPPAMLELAAALRPRTPGVWRGWAKIVSRVGDKRAAQERR